MSERGSRGEQEQQGSPLKTERGTTTVQDTVVARVVGRAAREVEGVHMGGGVSRRAGGLFTRAGESQPETQGVSVEVGSEEAAVDLTMAIQYGNNLLDVTRAVRDRINERVGNWVGLKVTEINITIENILIPEERERREEDEDVSPEEDYSGQESDFQREELQAQETEETQAGTAEEAAGDEPTAESREREEPVGDDTREIRTTPEGEKTQPLGQETNPNDESAEEVRVEGDPLEEGEQANLQVGQEGVEKRPAGEEGTSRNERREGQNRD